MKPYVSYMLCCVTRPDDEYLTVINFCCRKYESVVACDNIFYLVQGITLRGKGGRSVEFPQIHWIGVASPLRHLCAGMTFRITSSVI